MTLVLSSLISYLLLAIILTGSLITMSLVLFFFLLLVSFSFPLELGLPLHFSFFLAVHIIIDCFVVCYSFDYFEFNITLKSSQDDLLLLWDVILLLIPNSDSYYFLIFFSDIVGSTSRSQPKSLVSATNEVISQANSGKPTTSTQSS